MKKSHSTAPAKVLARDRLRLVLLGACAMLFTARPLVAGDLGAERGDGLLFVMLWILLFALWAFDAIRQQSLALRFVWADAAVLTLFGVVLAASLYDLRMAPTRTAINAIWEWIALALAYFLLRQLVHNAAEVRAVVAVMIALGAAQGALGYFQYQVDRLETINRYEAIKHDRAQMLRETGHWSPPGSPERKLFEDRLHSTEPFARFALANSLAGYLAPCLVVALGVALLRRGTHDRRGTKRATSGKTARAARGRWFSAGFAWTLLLVLMMGVCLVLTKSRTAVLAVLCGCGLLWLLLTGARRGAWRWPLLGAAAAVLLAAAAWGAGVWDNDVFTQAGKSVAYRLQYWRAAASMMSAHPIVGVGLGQFGDNYTLYKLPEASEEITDPHNFLLEIGVAAGLPGMFALLGAIAASFVPLWRRAQRGTLPDVSPELALSGAYRAVAGGAIVGLFLAMLASLMIDLPLPTRSLALLLVTLLAALFILLPWVRSGRLPPGLLAVGAAVLLVNLLAAGSLGFPGVAGSLWIMLAMGTSLVDSPRSERTYVPHVAFVTAAGAALLGLMCYLTAYRPVFASQTLIDEALAAQDRGDLPLAEDRLAAAVEADPYSAVLAQRLAEMRYSQLGQRPEVEEVRAMEDAMILARERAPRSASIRSQQGSMYFSLFERHRQPEWIARATALYRAAVERYPTSGLAHASLAMALDEHHEPQSAAEAVREAALALRLEGVALQAGHRDKEFPAELRQQLLRITGSSN